VFYSMNFKRCEGNQGGCQDGNVLPVAFSSAGWTGIVLVDRLLGLLQLSTSFDNLRATDVQKLSSESFYLVVLYVKFLDVLFEGGCWFEVSGFADVLRDVWVVVVIGFDLGRERLVGGGGRHGYVGRHYAE
jgi:hypothetical protein